MKKIISTLVAFVAMLQAPNAQAGCFDYYNDCCADGPSLELKFAAVRPFENLVRDIYNNYLPVVELEASFMFGENIKPWINVGYIWNNGYSIGEHDKTSIQVIPLALGGDFIMNNCFCNTDLYLGLGASYSWLKLHDQSPYVHPHTEKGAWGGVARTGFIYHYNDCIYLDGFLAYSYTYFDIKKDSLTDPLYVERHSLNFSNLKLGVGIGYNF